MSGDRPGPPMRSNAPNLEVTFQIKYAVLVCGRVMTVYWGCEAVPLIVCHDCTCVAAGSPIMHSFCGRLGPGTSPKCARNEIWTVYAAYTEMDGSSESIWLLGMACKVVEF